MNKDTSTVVIGLCGRSGSGKGYLSEIFGEFGINSIDTDAVYHEMTGTPIGGKVHPCMRELAEQFGNAVLNNDGSLNRRALSEIVFAPDGKEKLNTLNRITHRYILEETARRIASAESSGDAAVIIDAPLMFESGCDRMCDVIIAADAPEEVLLRRISDRDGISISAAQSRLASQISRDELSERADFVINTHKSRDELSDEVRELLSRITDKNYTEKGKDRKK